MRHWQDPVDTCLSSPDPRLLFLLRLVTTADEALDNYCWDSKPRRPPRLGRHLYLAVQAANWFVPRSSVASSPSLGQHPAPASTKAPEHSPRRKRGNWLLIFMSRNLCIPLTRWSKQPRCQARGSTCRTHKAYLLHYLVNSVGILVTHGAIFSNRDVP